MIGFVIKKDLLRSLIKDPSAKSLQDRRPVTFLDKKKEHNKRICRGRFKNDIQK